MRLRLAAAMLLAPLALGGCDRSPFGSGAALLGAWQSEEMLVFGPSPFGGYQEHWTFSDDGTFIRSNSTPDRRVLFAEQGTWRVSGDELRRTITARFERDPADADGAPDLVPITPEVERDRYELRGGLLLITPPCPPGVLCIAPRPLHHLEGGAG